MSPYDTTIGYGLVAVGVLVLTLAALGLIAYIVIELWERRAPTPTRRTPIIHDMCESCYRRPARTTVTNTDSQNVHVCHGCLDNGMVHGWWKASA